MQISLPILKHPKGGYSIDLNRLIDISEVLKKRDTDNQDRDFCLYCFEDENGITRYWGMGRYYNSFTNSVSKWLKSRPFTHRDDLLIKTITSNWTCRIISYGLTSFEAHVLEASILIQTHNDFSKIGTKEWDGFSLINKKREKRWERYITEYLGDGNNNWFTA